MGRSFNTSQRVDLYVQADGHCENCGKELEPGWHADHKIPYSANGPTQLWNGQALCTKCNLQKGDTMEDTVILRRFQGRYSSSALYKFRQGKKRFVGDIHPGSGKTLAVLDVANKLYRKGLINSCVVFVPRINLCRQFELDWKKYSNEWYGMPKMGNIVHRDNNPPLLRNGAFGYVTTYQSLVSLPKLHLDFVKRNPGTHLIVDEAQQLGLGPEGTKSADYIQELAEYVQSLQMVTGTPYRSDGSYLLFADYTDPDKNGIRYLEPDVRATYLEGVTEGYLRPFEYELSNGQAIHEYFDGDQEVLEVTNTDNRLYQILNEKGFWSEMVDMTIDQVKHVQKQIDPRLCGLIGAYGQKQARRIKRYLNNRHQNIKSLIAVSDESKAQKNLEEFKRGGYDILITVRMAYVGYDHKPISVVLMLSDFRDPGYLDQFFARGMRVMPDIPIEKQVLYAIVPDDPKMSRYVEEKRKESERGVRERNIKLELNGRTATTKPLGFVYGGEVTERRAQGMHPDGDLNNWELPIVEQIQSSYKMGASPSTEVGRLFRDLGESIQSVGNKLGVIVLDQKKQIPQITDKEKEELARKELHKRAVRCDYKYAELMQLDKPNFGDSMIRCNDTFGRRSIKKCGLEEIEESIKWFDEYWEPYLDKSLTRKGNPNENTAN